MRILVTGVCGFVGSVLSETLAEQGEHQIVGLDNLSRYGSERNRGRLAARGISVRHADLRCPSDLEGLPDVDWVIDAAANPSVLAGVDGQTSSLQLVESNLFGTLHLLEFCKRRGAGLVLLSTSRVYSIGPLSELAVEVVDDAFAPAADQNFPTGLSIHGVNEHCPTTPPVSLYGSTKLASEQLALEYGETFRFPVWINRCGVLAGAGQFGHPAQGIFSYWIHSFRERSPLAYLGFGGTGHQVRDALHPRDLAPLLRMQFAEPLQTDKPRIMNLGGGPENSMSLSQLTRWCETRYGGQTIRRSSDVRPFDIPWLVMDARRASEVWGWRPRTLLPAILEEIAEHADRHPDWLSVSDPRRSRGPTKP